MNARKIVSELAKHASPNDATFLQRFFKTGPGQYGEGDVFIGIRVPQTRKICKQFVGLPLGEVQKLLDSPVHEHRLAGVIILSYQYPKADEKQKQAIYDLYLKNVYKGRVNNWDIVDVTVDRVMGTHLINRPRDVLFELVKSDDVWQRRVAIMSTFAFIKKDDGSTTLQLAKILLHDKHDLIQKAVGWMLREVGKRVDRKLLTNFLDEYAYEMPRTMLRYSLEHLPPEQHAHYMTR
jgi:3-methyladenine DNA glycosylase AlkD